MENATIILMVSMNILLIIVLGVFGYFIYRLIKQQQNKTETPVDVLPVKDLHPGIVDRIKGIEKSKPKRTELFCPNHPDEPGEATCSVCDHLFCKACIRPFKSMHLCKEHLPLIMKNDWEEVLTLKTSTEDPEQGVKLYDVKKILFREQNIPMYIETHYKINVDQDYVETYLVLFAMKQEMSQVKEKLMDFQPFT